MGTMPSAQQLRGQLNIPELGPDTPMYRWLSSFLAQASPLPFRDLWNTDRPRDPALLAALQPVDDAITALQPGGDLSSQWDRLTIAARTARSALDTEPMGDPTVDEVVADIFFALKTTLLIAVVGQQGFVQISTTELVNSLKSAVTGAAAQVILNSQSPPPMPQRYFDVATNEFVAQMSATTLSLASFKYFANRDVSPGKRNPDIAALPKTLPAVAKQFAAQAIVNFYTDWEEKYRGVLATVHGCDERDFQIDYFGDLNRMRQDYVHRNGVSGQSDGCKVLEWFKSGDLMIPTPLNYCQLLTAFPDAELRRKPAPRNEGRDRLNVRADLKLIREFDRIVGESSGPKGAALDEALSDWIAKNQRTP
ncbi:hypothetical protein SAMN02799620_02023 [Mycolicibacterium fluoranthenivorans]|uniref:Uncharacterized protein n=2 Tax=Mycolicibacterium fluoranthenivorans TaxID=258505 RepID=A0A1G4W1H5_9MYCO|nr:hypothetical protein SAMN02799620_02023 [Mycolicibacterium fluoranthenivorans]